MVKKIMVFSMALLVIFIIGVLVTAYQKRLETDLSSTTHLQVCQFLTSEPTEQECLERVELESVSKPAQTIINHIRKDNNLVELVDGDWVGYTNYTFNLKNGKVSLLYSCQDEQCYKNKLYVYYRNSDNKLKVFIYSDMFSKELKDLKDYYESHKEQ